MNMNNTYSDLVEQTFNFPQEDFKVKDEYLQYNGLDIKSLIDKYGTPLKLSYLPKIGKQINKARNMFASAFKKHKYEGKYNYCYCTKSSHFSIIVEEALKHDIHLETSYAYDIDIIKKLYAKKKITKEIYIICNGYKQKSYTNRIAGLLNSGFKNVIPVLDNVDELRAYIKSVKVPFNLGIRVAADEEPNFPFYTSRLGIRAKDILEFYVDKIEGNEHRFQLKMLHIFLNKGIKDDIYYWSELNKVINLYCQLKKICPELDSINIGGGFPIKHSLGFEYDYQFMINEIVRNIKVACKRSKVPMPNIFTEFGSYTVAESGATLFSIIDKKQQNDNELWYMIDSSFITTLPDTWGIKQKFILLGLNHWDKDYTRVNIGGLTCDSDDYYNTESHVNQVYLPEEEELVEDPLFIGFFHTGAYQESLGGYGGIQHCLVPAPKVVIIDRDSEGEITTRLFAKEQSAKSMLKILGY